MFYDTEQQVHPISLSSEHYVTVNIHTSRTHTGVRSGLVSSLPQECTQTLVFFLQLLVSLAVLRAGWGVGNAEGCTHKHSSQIQHSNKWRERH